MRALSKRERGGFSLIELLIVLVMVGILSGIAIPNFFSAVWKARAAEVVADMHTVTLAYHEYLADGGGRLRTSRWGSPPAALEAYLPDDLSFSDEFLEYRWIRVNPRQSPWGLEMGRLAVRPRAKFRKLLMPKLALVAPRETSLVNRNTVQFYITP